MHISAAVLAVLGLASAARMSVQPLRQALEELDDAPRGAYLSDGQAASLSATLRAQLALFLESAEHKAAFLAQQLGQTEPAKRAEVLTAFYAAQAETLQHTQLTVDAMVKQILKHRGGFSDSSPEAVLTYAKKIKSQVVLQSRGEEPEPAPAQPDSRALENLARHKIREQNREIRSEYGSSRGATERAHQEFAAGYTAEEVRQNERDLRKMEKLTAERSKKSKKGHKSRRDSSSSSSDSDDAYVVSNKCPVTGKKGKCDKSGIVYDDLFGN